jgi:DNA-binding protein WhiA
LLRELRLESEIRTYRRRAFDATTRYQLHVEGSDDAVSVLVEAGVLGRDRAPLERPPGRVVARACCRSSYLRGAFLGAGSLSGPRSPHLEVRSPTHAGATFVRSVASTEGVRLQIADRATHSMAYAKAWDAIEGYLAAAGAVETVLVLEERALVADVRSRANRLANADHANLVRQSRASARQVVAAERLRARGELARLAPRLREAAELRLRHPTLSLRELARRCEPPATKASLQRRLARVVEIGESG